MLKARLLAPSKSGAGIAVFSGMRRISRGMLPFQTISNPSSTGAGARDPEDCRGGTAGADEDALRDMCSSVPGTGRAAENILQATDGARTAFPPETGECRKYCVGFLVNSETKTQGELFIYTTALS